MLRGLALCCALVACGSTTEKRAGESCTASSECANGLLCDLSQQKPVCADKGSLDAAVAVDGARVDAGTDAPRVIDARPDAPPDALADAPVD